MSQINNLPTVNVETFRNIVKSQIEEGNLKPIFGLGKGGIGKTESIMELATQQLKIGYIDIRLLLYSETDLKGIPYPNAEHTRTIWLQNNILPTVEKDGPSGILVFDEITSCSRSVRTAAYQLLNERKLGAYKLPDNWLIVCLGNGEEDGGDFNGMEANFANRCSVFNVVPDVDAWKNWAATHGINELVTAFINFKPAFLHSYDPEKETDILFASPRSWEGVSDILNSKGFDNNDKLLHTRIIGNVGKEVGDTFIAFCKFRDKTVDPSDILNGTSSPKINQNEILYITISSCVTLIQKKLDADIASGSVSTETVSSLAYFMKWLITCNNLETATMGIRDLLRSNSQVITRIVITQTSGFQQICPEFVQFAQEHGGIFM